MNFTDDYSHPDGIKVLYFSQNIPTKEVEELYKHNVEGCDCSGDECRVENGCSCSTRSGTYYTYQDRNDLEDYVIRPRNVKRPTYECSQNCSCRDRLCGNKLVQMGPRKGLIVKKCNDVKGLGLFTESSVKKGRFICEYAGEVINEEEAFKRFKLYKQLGNKMNYIFCINEAFGDVVRKTFIDPTKYGNIGRYINHGCEPNCALFITRIGCTMPNLGIFAIEDIEQGGEVTYDYCENDRVPENIQLRKNCFCGSQNCRKYLPFDETLS